MNLNSIYYGFTKDGKDRVLMEKINNNLLFGNENYVVYQDLESKEIFKAQEVEEVSLQPIYNLMSKRMLDKKRISKRKVIKIYRSDRDSLINVQKLFYGNIVSKNDTDIKVIDRDILFVDSTGYGICDEVSTSERFVKCEYAKDGVAVQDSRPVNLSSSKSLVLTKRKVLEKDYKKVL